MIFLRTIYSEPEGLFEKVVFKDGINIIFGGYKDNETRKGRGSLNSVGKSTLVKLINFCLLSSFDKRSELYNARYITDDYYIVLELEINNVLYKIKRSTKNQNIVYFGQDILKEYKLNILKKHFANLFFFDENYDGVFKDTWFRQLIPFFMRDEFNGFSRPIDYIGGRKDLELIPYNLFLLGIDNTLAYRNFNLRVELKDKHKTQTTVSKIITEKYSIDVEDVNSKLDELRDEIKSIEDNLKNYESGFVYSDVEKKADELTEEIKSLIRNNQIQMNRLKSYESNLKLNITVSTDKVKELYKQVNEDLGIKVKKSLDEVIEFKQNLVKSRYNFLKEEIDNLKFSIRDRQKRIDDLIIRRTNYLKILDERKALKDITNVVTIINEKNKELTELNGKVSVYNDLQDDILSIKSKEAELDIDIHKFIKYQQDEITDIRRIFNEIYNALYRDNKGIFNITYSSKRKDAKFDIKAQAPDSSGWGKSRAAILIYDLTILLNTIKQGRHFPRFLIHDGVFNGIFRGQFVSTMNYLNNLLTTEKLRFQYIFTANESDIWIDNTDDLEVDLENIKVTYYNDENKIFGIDFTKNT